MKWAILGGGGCFGLNLARNLPEADEVLAIGRSPLPGPQWTLGAVGGNVAYHQYHLLTQYPAYEMLLENAKPDVVVNFLAQADVAYSFRDSSLYYRTNLERQAALTDKLCGQTWLKLWIQVGSSEVYGSCENAVNENAPLRCSSPYAVSKAAMDGHVLALARVKKFPALVLRPSNCYCEGQGLYRIIPKALLTALSFGPKLPLAGGGAARKSYMHANDLARAIQLAVQKGAPGEVYNLGPANSVRICDLVQMCANACGRASEEICEDAPGRLGEDGCYWLDSRKAFYALNWMPITPLAEGIVRVRDWIAANLEEFHKLPLTYTVRP